METLWLRASQEGDEGMIGMHSWPRPSDYQRLARGNHFIFVMGQIRNAYREDHAA